MPRRVPSGPGRSKAALVVLLLFSAPILPQVTERVSLDSGGLQGNLRSTKPSSSSDGRFVAFVSLASNLVSGDTLTPEALLLAGEEHLVLREAAFPSRLLVLEVLPQESVQVRL